MSAHPQEYPQMTVEEFLAFEETYPEGRYEYIDGYIRDLHFLLMAGGTKIHAVIAVNISTALHNTLRAHGKTCDVYSADVRFALSISKYLHPDVSVSCHERDLASTGDITAPSLVVEVLSPSTEAYDHIEKLQMYNACLAIQEYLLVDTKRSLVEVFHRVPNGNLEYHLYHSGETIPLHGLGIDLPVDVCYVGVTFPD